MKLITLLAIESYKDDIKKLLQENGISVFSFTKIMGYRDNTLEAINSNWFGTEMNESESVLFIAFVDNSLVDKLFEKVDHFNDIESLKTKLHIASISIDKMN
jgi:nitrogen regulatory protein PII